MAVSYLVFFLYMECIRLRAEIILIILIETSLFCNVHILYALPFMHAYLSVIKGSCRVRILFLAKKLYDLTGEIILRSEIMEMEASG